MLPSQSNVAISHGIPYHRPHALTVSALICVLRVDSDINVICVAEHFSGRVHVGQILVARTHHRHEKHGQHQTEPTVLPQLTQKSGPREHFLRVVAKLFEQCFQRVVVDAPA